MIKGITFDEQQVPASAHRAAFAGAVHDGILDGCAMSYTGNKITIAAGHMIAHGAEIAIIGSETITVSGVAGYARVKLCIDMSKMASMSEFAQAYFAVDYASSIEAFAAPRRDETNLAGTIYEMPVCLAELSATGIKSLSRRCRIQSGLEAISAMVTLLPDAWVGSQQTVRVPGIESDAVVLASPALPKSNIDEYNAYSVLCIGQAVDALTFECAGAPSSPLYVNVLVINNPGV